MKIALIGPAHPYRGGIAHHSTMLSTYLRKRGHQVDLITFTRQYPAFLYPGKFQEELGDGPPAERMIDSMNPFNWISVGRELRRREYDLIAFRFWLPLFGPAFGTIARFARRKGGKQIMAVIDNFISHERRPGDLLLTKYFFRYCTMAITQSSSVEKSLREVYPTLPQVMSPHPTYENFGAAIPRDQARAKLGVTAPKVILFFGFVREYKGLHRLLAAMPAIASRVPDVHLYVVGEFFDSPEPYLAQIRDGGVGDHITIHDAYVSNEEVADWFSIADMVVMPYVSATNSGIVMIAYNFGVPAIVTDVGSLSEVVLDGQTGFVLADAAPETIASAVERMYQGDTIERFSRNIADERKKYTWDAFAEAFEKLVERVQSR
jgi:D-inositol-3-phosphate glycosyltransferase